VREALARAGIRSDLDLRNEKIDYKVREHSLAKVPMMLICGRREAANRTVALRRLGGEAQQVLALDQAVATLKDEARVPHTA
jgi:threonyl-tRNA synthetase